VLLLQFLLTNDSQFILKQPLLKVKTICVIKYNSKIKFVQKKIKNMNYFKILCIATSILFIYLFYQLFLNSDSFIKDLGLQPSETVSILCRRTSIFMLGISILLFCSKNLPLSNARQYICLSTGITMIGLACMGSYELMRGAVAFSILQAIVIETILGASFFIIFFKNKKNRVIQ
jgi:hypothetical protein